MASTTTTTIYDKYRSTAFQYLNEEAVSKEDVFTGNIYRYRVSKNLYRVPAYSDFVGDFYMSIHLPPDSIWEESYACARCIDKLVISLAGQRVIAEYDGMFLYWWNVVLFGGKTPLYYRNATLLKIPVFDCATKNNVFALRQLDSLFFTFHLKYPCTIRLRMCHYFVPSNFRLAIMSKRNNSIQGFITHQLAVAEPNPRGFIHFSSCKHFDVLLIFVPTNKQKKKNNMGEDQDLLVEVTAKVDGFFGKSIRLKQKQSIFSLTRMSSSLFTALELLFDTRTIQNLIVSKCGNLYSRCCYTIRTNTDTKFHIYGIEEQYENLITLNS